MDRLHNNFEEVVALDQENFVHPWEGLEDAGEYRRTFVEAADGIYIYDENGKRYIDAPGGMWCVQLGYGREDMAEAISAQVKSLAYFSPFTLSSSPAAILAGEIASRTPGDLNNVFFTTGGSTAVDSAIRFVHFRNNILGKPDKKIIISRQKAYHGSTYLAATVSGKERDKGWLDQEQRLVYFLPNVNPFVRSKTQSVEEFLEEKIADLENAILEIGRDKVAAFIAEPILASGGVIVPPKGYHKRCLEICRKRDVLYISDEVVTAFGRLGHWFASEEVFDIVPDIITCAKGLTSGYVPMGACILSDRIYHDVTGEGSKGATFSNGFTYSGHPVSAAAALKNIEIIEAENLLEHVREVTPQFQQRLHALRELPLVVDTRGEGLMGCVECSVPEDAEKQLDMDKEIGALIDEHCQEMGLIVRPIINMCVFSPPLIITREQIDEMFDILEKGIMRTAADLGLASPSSSDGQ
ncbi:MAG: aminotransferase [Pseudomonadota bacterium]